MHWLFPLAALPSVLGQAPAPAAQYYVPNLPGLSPVDAQNLTLYAGLIPVDSTANSNLFFSLVQAQRITGEEKLTIWLNGGPGCSSMDGLFLEVGPFRVQRDGTVKVVEHHWAKRSNVLFVDQPIGTGYSYNKGNQVRNNMQDVALDFVSFLRNFYAIFPRYAKMELYLSGESFAGTFIPYIAKHILDVNKQQGSVKINLQGILLGNGWIDPSSMYKSYAKVAFSRRLITEQFRAGIEQETATCMAQYRDKDPIKEYNCEGILKSILDASLENGTKFCLNMYDVRLRDTGFGQGCGMSWPTGLDITGTYLSRPDVIQALHAQAANKKWQECTQSVHSGLASDSSPAAYRLLPDILKEIGVVLFNGDDDLICNSLGIEYMVDRLNWGGAVGMKGIKPTSWYSNGRLAGTYRSARRLQFYNIFNASHMVAVDHPDATMDMFYRSIGVKNDMFPSQIGSTPAGGQDSDRTGERSDYDPAAMNIVGIILIIILSVIAGVYILYRLGKFWVRRRDNVRAKRSTSTSLMRETDRPWEQVPEDEDEV